MSAKIKTENEVAGASPSKRSRLNSAKGKDNFTAEAFKQFYEYQRHGFLCDFTILSKKSTWKVHKTVIAARSEFFAVYLVNNSDVHKYKIECGEDTVIKSCVLFMYTDTIVVNREDAEAVFWVSNKLKLYKLAEYCSEALLRNMSVENCLSVWRTVTKCQSLSRRPRWDELLGKTELVLFENLQVIKTTQQFKELSEDELLNLLKRAPSLQSGLDTMTCWISESYSSRYKRLQILLQSMDLPKLTSHELLHLMNNHIINSSSSALEMVRQELMRRRSKGELNCTTENWSVLRELFIRFKMTDLLTGINTYVNINLHSISKSSEFCKIDKATMEFFLKRSTLMNMSENVIWESLLRWTNFNKNRRKEFPDLLKLINLSRFSSNFIDHTVKIEPLVENDKRCLKIVIDALLLKNNNCKIINFKKN